MNRIVAGLDYTFDIVLSSGTGGPFELAGSSVTFTATTPGGVVALTQELEVNIFGVATVSDGLAIGSGGASSGQITQTLTAAGTQALPEGLLTWAFTLVDASGLTSRPLQGKWISEHATYLDAHLTRHELRRRIADRLGDLVTLEATGDSMSNTTFVDALNISGASDSLSGRQLYVVTGPNAGHVARVQASNESTNTLNFTPAAPTTFGERDIVDVFNERSRGWTLAEYNRVINAAIADAWPLAAASFSASFPAAFSYESPTITVPDAMHEVYEVAWQDQDGTWIPVRKDAWYGWSANEVSGTITFRSYPKYIASGSLIRLLGYGPHPALLDDSSETALHPEWLTAECAYRLTMSGLDKDNARGSSVLLHQKEREAMRSRIRTVRMPGTEVVRAR